ncbi:MAG: BMP family ABC transporter substrate-binding protein [Oscillospiraceae bacterium]|nr:BMP family ABC transporter substrate-binding protein [Oscillospiraceae bacterium]
MKMLEKNKYLFRFITVLLAVMCAVVATIPLTGCSDDDETDTTITTDEETQTEEEPLEFLRVGFIYSGTIANSTHNKMWEEARSAIEVQQGAETLYIENVFVSNFREAVQMLSMQDVQVIVSTTHRFASELEDIAGEYKDIVFISFGGNTLAQNITTFRPLLFQPAHVAGLAAGYNTGEGVDKVGVVVDETMYNAPAVVNAFIRGTRLAYKSGVSIHVRSVDGRNKAMVERGVSELRDEGVDTILSYIDTDYAIKYAERNDIKVVGYTDSISDIAPQNHVTGFGFNARLFLIEQINKFQHSDGLFFPSSVKGELDSGELFLSPLNTNGSIVLADTADLVNELLGNVINGDAPIFEGEMMDRHAKVQIPRGAVLTTEEILDMKWYEFSIGGNTRTLVEPYPDVPIVPLVIKGDLVTNPNHGGDIPTPSTDTPPATDAPPTATHDQ